MLFLELSCKAAAWRATLSLGCGLRVAAWQKGKPGTWLEESFSDGGADPFMPATWARLGNW